MAVQQGGREKVGRGKVAVQEGARGNQIVVEDSYEDGALKGKKYRTSQGFYKCQSSFPCTMDCK